MHDPAAPDRLVRGREIALLTNPTSGRGRGARHRDAALARLRESGLVAHGIVSYADGKRLGLLRLTVACVPGALEVIA